MSRLTVVLSQAPGKHPAKRSLEESIVAALIMEPGLEVSVVPNLYDLGPEHTGRLFLDSVKGDLVVLSWLYPRAAFWLLDRDGIKGLLGEVQLKSPAALLAAAGRRWYPVIDYRRCTNCLECLDFCLFGVYGVDSLERIVTENQDQCKKGCPACSRVCPQQAIIFPEYKSAAIAGAETGAVGGLKIDLSRLFGGDVGDALSAAVQERDRELVNDGRDAVGMTVGIPKRQADRPQEPKDDLDKLVDDLDNLGI